jgi:hypothetical protein
MTKIYGGRTLEIGICLPAFQGKIFESGGLYF